MKMKKVSTLTSSCMNSAERGLAMVELAILMPLLVMLVFGVFELGRALYQEQVITKAATAGARYMTRAYGVLDENCAAQDGWNEAVDNARNLTVFAGKTTPLISNMSVGDVSVSAERRVLPAPAGPVCVILVSVVFPFAGIFGETLIPFTDIGALTLNASSQAVYIGE